jgi:hypothetical protein
MPSSMTPSRPASRSASRLEVLIHREDAERFIEEVRGDDPESAAKP